MPPQYAPSGRLIQPETIAAAAVFLLAGRSYLADMARLKGEGVEEKAVEAAVEAQA